MRSNWIGNTALQERLQRADPDASVILEALRVVNEDGIYLQSEWDSADSTAGVTTLPDGGVKITGTVETLAEQATKSAAVVTDLDLISEYHVIEFRFDPAEAGKEIRRITCNLDPNADNSGVTVEEWRAQLFGVAEVEGDFRTLAPISRPVAVKHTGGTSVADVEFVFTAEEHSHPVLIPEGGVKHRDLPEPTEPGKPWMILFAWAVKGEGEAATNVAWNGDDSTSEASDTTWTARHRKFGGVARAVEEADGGRFEDRGAGDGIPHFKIETGSYTEQVLEFTGENGLDLGATPQNPIESVVRGQKFEGSDYKIALRAPGTGLWTEIVR